MVLTERPSRWRNSSPSAASRRQTLSRPATSFVAVICVSHPRLRPPADGVPPRQASPRPHSWLAAPSSRGPEPRPPVAVRDRRSPGASNCFVRGGRPRGLVNDGRDLVRATRHPIPPRPGAAPPAGVPRGRPVALFAAASCAVSSATVPPHGRRPPRPRSQRAAPSPPRPIALLQGAASPGEVCGWRPRGRPLALFAVAVHGSHPRRLPLVDGVSPQRVSLAASFAQTWQHIRARDQTSSKIHDCSRHVREP